MSEDEKPNENDKPAGGEKDMLVEVNISAEATPDFIALIEEAAELKPGDDRGAISLLTKAAAMSLSDLQSDVLVRAIHHATKLTLTALRKTLKTLQEKAKQDQFNASAPERERARAAYEAQQRRANDAERNRLYESCKSIAESDALLAGMQAVAHELGVVGEDAALLAVYLTCSSRLLADDATRLLRLGAPASGKNAVCELIFKFFPADAIVSVSGGSPKSLPYYGGADNEDALRHKVIYIPEGQALAAKSNAVENDFTVMLRTLISEGRVCYSTVIAQDGGPPTGLQIIKRGPIACIICTARDVDPELKTRALIVDTDESGEQTTAIVKRLLSGPKPKLYLQQWIDFQEWLAMDGPYEVMIPFAEQIFQAFGRWQPKFIEDAKLRIRRDVTSFLNGVKTSAILHKAKRVTTAEGVIVASLADYRHAYDAFNTGLAAAHGATSEKIIAVVKAIEEIRGVDQDPGFSIRVTLRDLAKKLRVASAMTARSHLGAAMDAGALEEDDAIIGRGATRHYKIVMSSHDLKEAPNLGIFPPEEVVRDCIDRPDRTPQQEEVKTEAKRANKKAWL